MRNSDVDRMIGFMIANRECAERGCMAYDDRIDGPGEMVRHEWVGLTEEEFSHGLQMSSNTSWMKAAKWIEAKLKHKNTVRMRRATRDEKISNPGVYWVEDTE